MDITNYIGKAIAYYRDKKEWSTVQLAENSGLSQGSISLYENGKRNPSDEALGKIAEALGVASSTILERAESIARSENPVVHEKTKEYGANLDYERRRQVERLYRFNDFVFELSPDILLAVNSRVFDIAEMIEYGGRGSMPVGRSMVGYRRDRLSLITSLTEKVFMDFIRDHKDEIAERVEGELHNLNMDAYQFIEELRKN